MIRINNRLRNIVLMCIYPPLLDGSAYSNFEFARGLSENGYGVEVIAYPCEGWREYDKWSEEALGIRVYRIPIKYVYEGEPPTQENLDAVSGFISDFLKSKNGDMPDIAVIGHDSWAWYEPVLHGFGLPVIQHLRGTPTRAINNGIYPEKERMRFINHVLNADHIIAIADHFRDLAISFGVSPEDVVTIRNGVDTSLFHPNVRNNELQKELEIEEGTNIIIHASNLYPVKRVLDIVESADRVLSERDDVVYLIAGEGPDTEKLHHAVRSSSFADKFRLPGKVPHYRMPDYMNLGRVFILASESEGYPRVALEAQACGLHLIASDMPAGIECTRNGELGTNYRMGDPDDLAEKTLSVLGMDEKTFEETKERALDYISSRCTFEKEISRYISCLERVYESAKSCI